MSFPPTLRDSIDESIFGNDFIDIHMDPNSIPAPPVAPFHAINDNISDEEEEEEEFEEDPEEDPAEDLEEDPAETPVEDPEQDMDATSGEPEGPVSNDEPVEAIPFFYARGSSGTGALRTARMRVRFPSSDYASTSRARAPHHSPTPPPTRFAPPPLSTPYAQWVECWESFRPTRSSPIDYTPSSEPPSPARFNPTWTPASWGTYLPSYSAPTHLPTPGASTSATPLPQPHTDPRVAQLMSRASDFHLRITQLEESVEILPGPAQLEDLSHEVQDMDERLNSTEHRVYQFNERVMARGALVDQVQRMDAQIQELLAERVSLRSRVRDLERRRSGR